MMLVLLVSLIGLGINDQILKLSVETFGLEEMIGKVIATGVTFVWNFSARQFWIYREVTSSENEGN